MSRYIPDSIRSTKRDESLVSDATDVLMRFNPIEVDEGEDSRKNYYVSGWSLEDVLKYIDARLTDDHVPILQGKDKEGYSLFVNDEGIAETKDPSYNGLIINKKHFYFTEHDGRLYINGDDGELELWKGVL